MLLVEEETFLYHLKVIFLEVEVLVAELLGILILEEVVLDMDLDQDLMVDFLEVMVDRE
jgi:hypothetical protein